MALVWLLFGLVAVCLYLIHRRLNFVSNFRKFPGPKAWPILGNSLSLLGSQADFLRLIITESKKNSNGTLCLWVGMRPFVFLHKADVIKPLVTSQVHTEKNFEYTLVKDWLGEGLITSKGLKWVKHRQLILPSFHCTILNQFSGPIRKQTLIFLEQLKINSQTGKEVVIFPFAKRLALDLICDTVMGTSVSAQINVDSDYVLAIARLADIVCRRFITPILKPDVIFNNTPIGLEQKHLLKKIHGFVMNVIAERKLKRDENKLSNCTFEKKFDINDSHSEVKNKSDTYSNGYFESLINKQANNNYILKNKVCRIQKVIHESNRNGTDISSKRKTTLLDLLLEYSEHDPTITEKDILDEVNTFMFAGHDTVASAISFTLFALGHNPEWQEKIVEEINLLCPNLVDEVPSLEVLKQLDILDRCVKESLRLYPVAPLVGRTIRSPLETPAGVLVPGTTAVMNIFLLHRDPAVFVNPEKFDPDRFLPENVHTDPYAYIPFSAGPRNCVGKRLAILELKTVLAMVLAKFQVTSIQVEQELDLSFEIVLFSANDMKLVFKERTV